MVAPPETTNILYISCMHSILIHSGFNLATFDYWEVQIHLHV